MIKPYYQDEWATIYCADCRDVLPHLEPVDLVLTDPPYGINYTHSGGGLIKGKPCRQAMANIKVAGDDVKFNPSFLLRYPKIILWGANHYADVLPVSAGWLVWDKREASTTNSMSDCEMAWTNFLNTARLFHHLWNGLARASESGQVRVHPTQKPLALMKWCLTWAKDCKVVLDPFMGSGTTLRAAKDLGIKSIGIEIEEKYCEIAARRLRQESLLGLIRAATDAA